MVRQLKSGMGWRLGWNPDAEIFQGLVGTDSWAVELTKAELADFCRLVLQLAETMHAMQPELMEEERMGCETESDLVWLEVEGFPHAYRLRLILLTGRRTEAEWTETAVPGLLQAIQTLQVF
ncbi:MAG: DUF1818 family protein [Cyanobacteria bacterium RM1_2_2]|nr:DUF1818 family protein [Cyanobacteria bacterium RM1_2_2]